MDSHPQDFPLLKTTAEQNKEKMTNLLCSHLDKKEIDDLVWDSNGCVCGKVVIQKSTFWSYIKLQRYELDEANNICYSSGKWKNFTKLLPFSPNQYFKNNGDFFCYGYSISPGTKILPPLLEYSVSKEGKQNLLLCVIDFNTPCEEYHKANPFFASLGNIDEDDLLKAILGSPFQEKENTKVYPLADVVFPEYYKSRVRHADIFEHEGYYLFLSKFPPALRLRVKQAIFHQFVYKRLMALEEVTKLIKQYFTNV